MKKFLVAAIAAFALATSACTSIDSAKVDGSTIASNGEAVAVVQAVTLGFSLFFDFVVLTESDLDLVVNKVLVTEAKALGGNKVGLKAFGQMPDGSILFQLSHGIAILPPAMAIGIAGK